MKQVLSDGKVPVKVWTMEADEATLKQLRNLAQMPFIHHQGIAVMADCHCGIGSTIGSVIPTVGAIIPAAVGVDIGCVDKDSEFLSPFGWKKISTYEEGDLVMQYDPDTKIGSFVKPTAYIKRQSSGFIWIKTKYGLNQRLSPDHRCLVYVPYGRERVFEKRVMSAQELLDSHESLVLGFRGRFETTFTPNIESAIDLTDEQLRVMVMVCADGHFPKRRQPIDGRFCTLHLVKQRKIKRAKKLLKLAGIEHSHTVYYDNQLRKEVARISFEAPIREKSLGAFWNASLSQLGLITEEALHWDGNHDQMCFYSTDRRAADFMHYAFTAVGYRSVLYKDKRLGKFDGHYRVFAHANTQISPSGSPKTKMKKVKSKDGYEYCFQVPTGFWVMRRRGNIVMTGNCGMSAVRLSLTASDLPDSLSAIRGQIERDIPLGAGGAHPKGKIHTLELIKSLSCGIPDDVVIGLFNDSEDKARDKWYPQLGTLGSGNHFIEICLDEEQRVWVMLHSGSRGIGNMIGTHYISKARKLMEKYFITLPDKDLAFFPEKTTEFDDYMDAVHWAQRYARLNRRVMMDTIIEGLHHQIKTPFTVTDEAISCHHNYVAMENHFGANVWVTRKGAIRARDGDLGIIPGARGAQSFIVRGKGNPQSYQSSSHGAGRKMSRTEARKKFTKQDLIEQSQGVECSTDIALVDEIRDAYKPIAEVMDNQRDLVDIVHTLTAVVNVKGA